MKIDKCNYQGRISLKSLIFTYFILTILSFSNTRKHRLEPAKVDVSKSITKDPHSTPDSKPPSELVAKSNSSISQGDLQKGILAISHPPIPECLKKKKYQDLLSIERNRKMGKCALKYVFEAISIKKEESKKCMKILGNFKKKSYPETLKRVIAYVENNQKKEYLSLLHNILIKCGDQFIKDFEQNINQNFKVLKDSLNEFVQPRLRRLVKRLMRLKLRIAVLRKAALRKAKRTQ